MKVTPYIAQSIVDRTMKLLTYNINIMDDRGIIIGSGDELRLNTYHQVAAEVIKNNKPIAIGKENADKYKGCQEGLNLPIYFNEKPVGVVGITGNPEEIKIYGKLVQTMAELMLEENFYWEQMNAEEQARFSLINDLIGQNPVEKEDSLRFRSELLKYDLKLARVVIVFEVDVLEKRDVNISANDANLNNHISNQNFYDPRSRRKIKNILNKTPLDAQDLFASGIHEKYVLLKSLQEDTNQDLDIFIKSLVEVFHQENIKITIGVGSICSSYMGIPDSFDEALQALRIGNIFYGGGKVYHLDKLSMEIIISQMEEKTRENYISEVFNNLLNEPTTTRQKLIETVTIYLDSNLKLKKAAETLFIHRNTLAYRISSFNKITGLNLYRLKDVVKVKIALMCWQYAQNKDFVS